MKSKLKIKKVVKLSLESLEEKIEKEAKAIRVAYIRLALRYLPDKKVIRRIFYDIAPMFADRNGGYTSVLKLSRFRLGDKAPQAILRLVEEIPPESPVPKLLKR